MFRRQQLSKHVTDGDYANWPVYAHKRRKATPLLWLIVAMLVGVVMFYIFFGLGFFYLFVLMVFNKALPRAKGRE
jgi:hypothetical protein